MHVAFTSVVKVPTEPSNFRMKLFCPVQAQGSAAAIAPVPEAADPEAAVPEPEELEAVVKEVLVAEPAAGAEVAAA